MRNLWTQSRRLAIGTSGAAAAEYALTLALILMVAVSGVALLNTTAGGLYTDHVQLSQSLSTAGTAAATGGRQAGSSAEVEHDLPAVLPGNH